MAFVNNNKKNARFNPNARDDRVLPGYVSSRRVHKERKEVEPQVTEELISTDPEHVLSMEPSIRVDWFHMALMQAATGKLKGTALYGVVLDPMFAVTKQLKAMVLANLHLFSPKQQKAIKESVTNGGSSDQGSGAPGGGDRDRQGKESGRSDTKRSRRNNSSRSKSRGRGRHSSRSRSRSRGRRGGSSAQGGAGGGGGRSHGAGRSGRSPSSSPPRRRGGGGGDTSRDSDDGARRSRRAA
eukprot:TRINITY_DN68604_c0_g1_i1.p1 TRINITY_DN68604_c0_g1~~TRINITY_DN68604_c0_g1_i1.p1  ORF type:complete len:282 (-),score=52.24 TRINITY_DN68604_c0_g1_i1:284-1003(-)